MTDASLGFFTRLWLAVVCAFRVVLDEALAVRVARALNRAPPEPREGDEAPRTPQPVQAAPAPEAVRAAPARAPAEPAALGLLALLQREGRFVDFLKQDIDAFGDADVGSAARVVHAGCRKALLGHVELVRIRDEAEGSPVTVPAGFDGRSVKLTGNVRGTAPYQGVLRHAGWRAQSVRLPELVAGYDAAIIAPAEVEL